MQKQNKTQWAVGAVALVFGLLVGLQVEGVALGWLVVTAPAWGGVIVALVGATVREVSMVGGALDEPTRVDEVAGVAWAAASQIKKRGKNRARTDVGQAFGGYGVRLPLRGAATRASAVY
ncbi:hypothetical protein [Chitinimonas lacunae]|uniref:Uncharacterized protein n=1 Tax=Chitinimonas lacunae TaxID=1963018 RepID=A0ABV8MJE5_9NEIS